MPAIPDEFMRPPMMAIGDSLYNGVRSLTIKNGLAQLSAPAQVAVALGLRHDFFCPDYGKPVLVDMEKWIRLFPNLKAIEEDYRTNAKYWLARPKPESARPVFDNIAIASTTIEDLYTDTWASAQGRIDKLRKKHGSAKLRSLYGPIGDLFFAVNTKFVLNPMGRAGLKSKTQIEQVEDRMPDRLLVSTGSNNGLWDICFDANPSRTVNLTGLKTLAQCLNALPAEVKHIYFNTLPLPSTVPNLMPIPDFAHHQRPANGSHFKKYENRMGFGYGTITGTQMERLDKKMIEVNKKTKQIVRDQFDDKKRIRFVDMAALFNKYDSKHRGRTNRSAVVLRNRKRLRNYMLIAHPWGFREGGLMGLDGMHPTVVGYAMMAQHVVDVVSKVENRQAAKIDIDAAFERDSLLTDMPGSWSYLLWLWRDIRRAQGRGGHEETKHPDGDENASVADKLMSACVEFKTC